MTEQQSTNSTEKEFIVTLRNASDWDQFHNEMIKNIVHPFVPNRNTDCANERPFSETQSHYWMTDQEAAELRNDPRVLAVEWNPDDDPDVDIVPTARSNQQFDNSLFITASMRNWGLLRATSINNPFASTSSLIANYNYNLTGRGVDIVIIDSGVAENHPEFAVNEDGTGGSRVQDYDWTQLGVSGVTALSGGSGIKGFLGDCEGHGSNCASIAAGITCGWAKEAKIYSIRAIPSSTGSNTDIVTGATLGLISSSLVFDLVRAFHLAKPIQANGYRRPTICTNSWTYARTYSSMVQTSWRGTTYTTTSPTSSYGQVSSRHPLRVTSVDIAAANAMSAGVIIVAAAGNYSHKIDVIGGQDYNNSWTNGSTTSYYHRGSTPGSTTATASDGQTYNAITVGALDRVSPERKASFSETGPRVDVYAPGVNIAGAGSNNYGTTVSDSRNATYKLSKLSGTSQATPQIAGILACTAQLRPWMNQNSARSWIIGNSLNNVLNQNSAGGTGYTNSYFLQGGSNKIGYMPFNRNETVTINGNFGINTPVRVL